MEARDHMILELLQAEIGRRVGLAAATVNERIRRLTRAGVIRRWTALVDDRAAGSGAGRVPAGNKVGWNPPNDEEGQSYVVRQPLSKQELEWAMDAMEMCPVGAIGADGEEE